MPAGAAFTATALAAVIGTIVMAFWAKLPFGLAPGMGLNAFFVYTVCLGMGYPRTCQVPCLSASWRQHSLASRWGSLNSREYSKRIAKEVQIVNGMSNKRLAGFNLFFPTKGKQVQQKVPC